MTKSSSSVRRLRDERLERSATPAPVPREPFVPERTDGRRYEAVLRLSEALSLCREPEDLTKILAEQLREFLDFLQFYIIVYKEESSEVEWAVLGREKSMVLAAYADVPVQLRPSWQVYTTQEPIYIRDLNTDNAIPARFKQGVAAQGLDVGPVVFVPLTTPHRRLGALAMSGAPGTTYSNDDVSFLRLIGRVVAFAIDDNFNLRRAEVAYEEMQRQNQQLLRSERELRETEARFRAMADTAPVMIWTTGTDGLCDYFSKPWLDFTGRTMEQEVGMGWTQGVHPDDLQACLDCFLPAFHARQRFSMEYRLKRADGEYRWVIESGIPRYTREGEFAGYIGSNIDITDRKRAESLLAGEKRVLEMLAKGDSLTDILDSLCRFVEEQAGGVRASILLLDGDRLRHGGAPSLPKAYTDAIDGAAIGPTAGSCGTAAYRGEQVIVEDIATDPLWAAYRDLASTHALRACWSTPVFSSQERVIATFAMYYREPRRPSPRDQEIIEQITHLAGVAIERKLTQEALLRSETYLAEAQKLTHTGSWVWDVRTREATYLSDEWYRIYGLPPGSPAQAWEQRLQVFHPEDRSKWEAAANRAISEKSDYELEYRLLFPDGTTKYIHVVGHPVFNPAGEAVQFMGSATDITERKQAEQALRRSEAYLAEAQRLTHTGSWAWNLRTDELFWSQEVFRIYEIDPPTKATWSKASWSRFLERVHPEDRARIEQQARMERTEKNWAVSEIDFRVIVADGTIKHVHAISYRVTADSDDTAEVMGTIMDVTERRQAETERERLYQLEADLARTNRVSMMGELAASLAHEIKQPISAALINAGTCREWLGRDQPDIEEARQTASRIIQDVTRASEIMNRVRSLFKKDEPQRERIDVNDIIRGMIGLLRNEAGRHSILIHTDFASDLPAVSADPVQLQQVLMNLMLNGIEAIREQGNRGELTVRSQPGPSHQVLISVTDTGVGLPPDRAEKIFEAFFTTKSQGSGMGLSISRSIVESHGGRLWATPNSINSMGGTTFQFTLPSEAKVA